MSQTLSVTAIEQGCVIDHIPAGQGIKILQALCLPQSKYQITVGLNLPSQRRTHKDIIKIEGLRMCEASLLKIGIMAPGATVNEIESFTVTNKHVLALPEFVKGLFKCPNTQCISHSETVESHFGVHNDHQEVQLSCHYCEALFDKSLVEQVTLAR